MKSTGVPLRAALVGLVALVLAGCGQEAAPQGKAQTKCPVMGGDINKEVFDDHEGKRVYFCCPDCIEKFKKEPQKYVKKLEDEGVTLAKTPHKGG
ncbi:MAG: YHS domain-containing protein [Planctomycetes bacterium]|nr:YHS domain-containing protein [Planctomycetota bacterium]